MTSARDLPPDELLDLALLEVARDPGPARVEADVAYAQMVLGRHCLNNTALWGGLMAAVRMACRG